MILSTLAALSILQIGLKKQRRPTWTQKARILVATGLLIDIGLMLIVIYQFPFPFSLFPFPFFQPLILAVSLLLWRPVDKTLKGRIIKRAKELRSKHPNLKVIGITGSAGKTTVKELLAHILAGQDPIVTPAYMNADIGVARWMINKLNDLPEDDERILIVEMGAYRKGEIRILCQIAKPHMGVITMIGRQHIALFGSEHAICEAKGELIEELPDDGYAFLNSDNELCAGLRDRTTAEVITVGTGGSADLEANDIEETGEGIQFKLQETKVVIPLHGTHNVTNILLAIAV